MTTNTIASGSRGMLHGIMIMPTEAGWYTVDHLAGLSQGYIDLDIGIPPPGISDQPCSPEILHQSFTSDVMSLHSTKDR